jgi:hemophore-related protein
MGVSGFGWCEKLTAISAGCLVVGTVVAILAAPMASAAPDCSSAGVAKTVSSVTSSVQQFLATHPGASKALRGASGPQGQSSMGQYFAANPNDYTEIRAIVAPIGVIKNQCDGASLPPALLAAYNIFAGS